LRAKAVLEMSGFCIAPSLSLPRFAGEGTLTPN
jgi:hypothetical protein